MRRDLLTAVLHGAILWALGRLLATVVLSSGAQDVIAIAAATTATTAAATVSAAWIGRSLSAGPVPLARRFLPVPVALAVLTAYLLVTRGATAAQVVLGTAPWLVGAALALLVLGAAARRRPRDRSMVSEFA